MPFSTWTSWLGRTMAPHAPCHVVFERLSARENFTPKGSLDLLLFRFWKGAQIHSHPWKHEQTCQPHVGVSPPSQAAPPLPPQGPGAGTRREEGRDAGIHPTVLPEQSWGNRSLPNPLWGSLRGLGEDGDAMAVLPTLWLALLPVPTPLLGAARGKWRGCPSLAQSWGPIQP